MLGETNNQEIEYGSIRDRVLACVFDLFIVISIIAMFGGAAYSWSIFEFELYHYIHLDVFFGIKLTLTMIALSSFLFVPLLYTVTLVASKKQSTFGMRRFNIIVVDKNMHRLSLWHSFARYIVSFLVSAITSDLGYLTAVFRQDKQGLHDIICETYVIYKK
ncbi:MAG: hypothetical protein COC22_01855 [Flavobacteriaceae bacterium]|nr:MAG: hypothetical protein COC22_01855 [Flavobacteriaceae bacterium]